MIDESAEFDSTGCERIDAASKGGMKKGELLNGANVI